MRGDIQRRLDQIKKDLKDSKLAKVGYDFFVQETPVKSGFAKNSTLLKDHTIYANYPYAQRLDEGYSKQAPKGMTEPTIVHVQKYIKRMEKK
jgi:hypothetical protein